MYLIVYNPNECMEDRCRSTLQRIFLKSLSKNKLNFKSGSPWEFGDRKEERKKNRNGETGTEVH